MTWLRRDVVAAVLAALVFSALALGSGLDRYSEFDPDMSRLVPEPFQAYAARQLGLRALVRGDLAAAREGAERALRHEPMNPRSVSLVALVRGKAGDEGGADAAHRVGTLLGWREVATQLYWFEQNYAVHEYEAAALRLDALLRSRSDMDILQTMLGKLEAVPGGRQALALRLRSVPVWADAYLSASDSDDAVLRARAGFLAARDVAIPDLGCSAVEPMIETLATRRFRRDAEALARRQCPRLVRGGLLGDGDFADFIAGRDNPFGWTRNGAGDLRVTPQQGSIEIANRASVSRLVLSQPMALDPGRYVLRGKVDGLEPDMFVATLDCGYPKRPVQTDGSVAEGGQVLVAKGCENEVLGLWLRATNGALTVSNLSLTAG